LVEVLEFFVLRLHQSSPESVHLRRTFLFSLAFSMERREIITT
jgi:hypothetical protein